MTFTNITSSLNNITFSSGIILTSYFMFDAKTYNDIFDIVSTVQVLAIATQLVALYLSVKDKD